VWATVSPTTEGGGVSLTVDDWERRRMLSVIGRRKR
jgi:hypothetical protein